MARLINSLIRIAAGVVGIVAALLFLVWLVFTQPSVHSIAFSAEGRASAERLEEHVRYLASTVVPRDSDHPENLDRAASYIHEAFLSGEARVSTQDYIAGGKSFRNVIASFGPTEDRRFVLGAHYDAFGGLGENPGADDNASGTAALLELARLLSAEPPPGRVDLVAFSTEEPPFFRSQQMGSAVHARSLKKDEAQIRGMIAIEMIGYYTNAQPWPHWLYGFLYPESGDFIGVVGRLSDRKLARFTKACFRGLGAIRAHSVPAARVSNRATSGGARAWKGFVGGSTYAPFMYSRGHGPAGGGTSGAAHPPLRHGLLLRRRRDARRPLVARQAGGGGRRPPGPRRGGRGEL